MRFDAVAFDLDGTLYPTSAIYLRAFPSMLTKARRLAAFNDARQRIRAMGVSDESYRRDPPSGAGAFRALEARMAASAMGMGAKEAESYIDREFYAGVEELFSRIKPFRGLAAALDALAERGLRLAVLSDLPTERKLELLGLAGKFEAALCSSDSGFLKPAAEPFLMLADRLGLRPERILYVGNSVRMDAGGARGAGMKSALVSRRRRPEADFSFWDWSRLVEYALS